MPPLAAPAASHSAPVVSVSIVSHGQGAIVASLLKDLAEIDWHGGVAFEVILTLNIPEDETWLVEFVDMPITVRRNTKRLGYGANHNAAFGIARGKFFIVANPDIRLRGFRLEDLLRSAQLPGAGVCGPLVRAPDGALEDSARRFPTVGRLFFRKLLQQTRPDYSPAPTVRVDWLAGMFLLFPADVYRRIGGFDERYFMYFEDVEICQFLRLRGFEVIWVGTTAVTHDAARASRRSPRHMRWYAISMSRYLAGRSRH